jgi:2Fe-2S ferredoxin
VPKIVLQPGGRVLKATRKVNLLKFLQDSNVSVGSACGGKGICASCKITVLNGAQNLSRPNDREMDLAERNHLDKNERIACQSKVLGDIEITTSYWKDGDTR